MMVARGVTRIVLVFDRCVVKFPTLYNWWLFLHGLLANLHEWRWWSWTNGDARLCPVLFCCPGGFFLVMRRAERVCAERDEIDYRVFDGLPVDPKPPNFGIYNGRVVLIDYGS